VNVEGARNADACQHTILTFEENHAGDADRIDLIQARPSNSKQRAEVSDGNKNQAPVDDRIPAAYH
jgi:hypothetical protein